MIRDRDSGRPPRLLALALLLSALPLRGADAPPPDPAARLAEAVPAAQKLVEQVRGAKFRAPVAFALLPEKELPKILGQKLVEDLPTTFEKYAASLAALGLIEEEPELFSRITRLYARQVVGFYDPDVKKFFLVPERAGEATAGVPELGAGVSDLLEESLLTHELTHALQDQRLELSRKMHALKDDSDALLAMEAFLEGEATVVMTEGLLSRLPEEQRALLGADALTSMLSGLSSLTGTSGVEGAEGVPPFFVKELVFPYVGGSAFIQARRRAGGWASVDASYAALPSTTAEILHPERARETRPLAAADRPGKKEIPSDGRFLYADTLGEWIIRTLLEPAGAEEAEAAAAARRDDRISFFERPGGGVGFLWRIRAADAHGAARLAKALTARWAGRPPATRPRVEVAGDVVSAFTSGLIGPKGTVAPAEGK